MYNVTIEIKYSILIVYIVYIAIYNMPKLSFNKIF